MTEAAEEQAYPDPQKGRDAEQAAMEMNATVTDQTMPIRQYLDTYIAPTLNKALTAVAMERPEDPVDWIAHYLLKNREEPDTGKVPEPPPPTPPPQEAEEDEAAQ